MTSVIPARRRAEEFAALVDGGGDAAGTRHDDLVELVTALRGTPLVAPRPEFVTELRAALMAEAEVALSSVDSRLALPAHTRTRRDRRFAIAAGTVALIGAGSSMAVAAQDALPGDALYPIKRVIEGAQSTLTVDEVSKGEALLANASGRLAEVSALQARNSAEGIAAMPDTLDDFSAQADDAADVLLSEYARTGDRDAVTELRTFTAESMDTLVELGADLPSSARTALEHAAQVLKQIDDRAAAACPECGGGIDEVPPMFLRSFSDGLVSPATTSTAPPVVITPIVAPSTPKSGDGRQRRRLDPVRRRQHPGAAHRRRLGRHRRQRPGARPDQEGPRRPAGLGPEGPGQGPRGRGRRPAARRRRRRHRPARSLIRPLADRRRGALRQRKTDSRFISSW